MRKLTYTQLINETINLYLQDEFSKAYDYITQNGADVVGNQAQIYNFRYAIASKSGEHELALEIMKEAIIDKGYWYAYEYLMDDDDLEPLRELEAFGELANICKEREKGALDHATSEMLIRCSDVSKEGESGQLIMALHGNQENNKMAENHWRTALKGNTILALPQSSVIEFSEAYNWEDADKGVDELKEHYDNLLEQYPIDAGNVIMGGFSAGCNIILKAILKKVVKARGLILVGPWLPEIDELEQEIDILKEMDMKCYVICGDQDEDCLEGCQKFVEMLADKGIGHQYIEFAGLDHDFPTTFAEELEMAIDYINQCEALGKALV